MTSDLQLRTDRHAAIVGAMRSRGDALSADDIFHHSGGGVYAKQVAIRAGYMAMSHQHPNDHLSILASGKARVTSDGQENVYEAPAVITIAAGVNHAVHALTDVVWFCLHASEETDFNHIDAVLLGKS